MGREQRTPLGRFRKTDLAGARDAGVSLPAPSRLREPPERASLGGHPTSMKTLAAFSKPIDAHLLIARLKGNGITAFARDENVVTLDWLMSNAIGGVKVDVADEDYERAVAVMDSPPGSEENA
jgi:hypothetical protein